MTGPSVAVSATMAASPPSVVTDLDHDRLVAAPPHHVFDEPALDRVIVGDQNGGSHGIPRTLQLSVLNRGTLADGD